MARAVGKAWTASRTAARKFYVARDMQPKRPDTATCRDAVLDQSPKFHWYKKSSKLTAAENLSGELTAVALDVGQAVVLASRGVEVIRVTTRDGVALSPEDRHV